MKFGIVGALALSAGLAGTAFAFDPEKKFKPDEEPRTVLRFGFQALKNGNMEEAIGAFRFGAKRNDLASQWKLARMLQSGNGLPKDDYAAFKLYAKIAARFDEQAPRREDRAYVSNAVVTLGKYYAKGIKGSPIRANPRRAEDHYYRAAALYHDPEAQFRLGLMYRRGALGTKQPRSAARWLGLAARKGHVGAQAHLGEMLFHGEGVRRNPVRGLVFMSKAVGGNARRGVKTFRKMQKKAFATASEAQRKAAESILSKINPGLKKQSTGFALEQVPSPGALNASRTD